MRRANNQDSLAALPAKNLERYTRRGHLFVVADGMGAHAAGELASRMATDSIAMHYFRNNNQNSMEALREAVQHANDEIHRRGQQNPEFHNMGTTASAMALLPAGAIIAHVGDSRIYRLRKGVLEQLTFDHSLVWEMEASGQLQLSQTVPKNVITRSLGPNRIVEVDMEGPFQVETGDKFLLCSDGLTGPVEDAEIGTLMDCLPEDLAARVLVDLANLRGGPDNTTVIIAHMKNSDAKEDPAPSQRRDPTSLMLPVLYGLAALGFLSGIALAAAGRSEYVIVPVMLGLISAAAAIYQTLRSTGREPEKSALLKSKNPGGNSPYKSYDARPTKELYQRMGTTVEELRQAATTNNWMMDWTKVDKYQRKGLKALNQKNPKTAIRSQAKAIIETMHQLRDLNDRAARETSIEANPESM